MNAIAEKFCHYFDEHCANSPCSGVLQVRLRDELIYRREMGKANYEQNIPFSDQSAFNLYSLSKPFCAIGFMKLWDRGLVDLDAHPGNYVPEAETLHPGVTMRYLLQHISGLPDFAQTKDFAQKYAPGTPERLREHLRLISHWPMRFEPGTQGLYANINFIIPSLVIENLTGMDYGDYMRREVFLPLGMENARVDLPGLAVSNRVQGYELKDGKPTPIDWDFNWMRGAGDIIACADEVYCLSRAIQHRKLLSQRAWDEILTVSPVSGFGLGCGGGPWYNKTLIRHNGGAPGFRTLHIQVPEDDFDLIFLSNFGFADIRSRMIDLSGEILYGSGNTLEAELDKGYI